MSESDAELIEDVIAGDQYAFGSFYDRYSPAVARFAWSLSPTMDQASEIVQETFLTAWRKAAKIHLVGGSALPWLLTTCRNHARNHARGERRWQSLIDRHQEALMVAVPETGDIADELGWALDAIAALPDLDRRVCELCLLRGLSYREAAERLGISESAAGKRLQRARTKLREQAPQ